MEVVGPLEPRIKKTRSQLANLLKMATIKNSRRTSKLFPK